MEQSSVSYKVFISLFQYNELPFPIYIVQRERDEIIDCFGPHFPRHGFARDEAEDDFVGEGRVAYRICSN